MEYLSFPLPSPSLLWPFSGRLHGVGCVQHVASLGDKGVQTGKRSMGFGASRPGFWSPRYSPLSCVTWGQSLPSLIVSFLVCQILTLVSLFYSHFTNGPERGGKAVAPGPQHPAQGSFLYIWPLSSQGPGQGRSCGTHGSRCRGTDFGRLMTLGFS